MITAPFVLLALGLGLSPLGAHASLPEAGSPAMMPFRASVKATGMRNIISADRARAAHMKHKAHAQSFGTAVRRRHEGAVPVTNTAVTYTAQVGVGSPATNYTLLIDTGSSNTWVGADKAYVKTSTSKSTYLPTEVSYGSGMFAGIEHTDTVTLGPSLVITEQLIGVSDYAEGFSGVDGILGIGPVALTSGTVMGKESVPTVSDNLYSQGTINTESIGIYYAPATSDHDFNGELYFGGVDESKITSDVHYTPITTTSPASKYWGIDQSVSYGSTEILSTTSGIVDTGTTLVLIASDAFSKYKSLTGATEDATTGLLTITQEQYDALEDLHFQVDDQTYSLTPNAQIWPRALNADIGGVSGQIYLVVSDLGSMSGEGLDFIDGYTFLERFYSVFDTTNSRVGFARTAKTDAETN